MNSQSYPLEGFTKIHHKLDCDREYIDQETVSAFSNWLAPCVPRGLFLTKAKDSALSAATYPQQCASNECHSVLVLINSANPLWDPNTVQALFSAYNQCALPLYPCSLLQPRLCSFGESQAGICDNSHFFKIYNMSNCVQQLINLSLR